MTYFKQICTKLGYGKKMYIVDKTFHPSSLKECTKILMKNWMKKWRDKDFTNDYQLMRLLTHDGRKYFWFMLSGKN